LAAIYDKIARRLEGELVPFTNLEEPGIFGRLFAAFKAS
jgi:septum formation inhibitor-activating ATPase MinD